MGRYKGKPWSWEDEWEWSSFAVFLCFDYLFVYYEHLFWKVWCVQIHLETSWQYIAKLWYCIDYILMRQCQRKFCHDAPVLCKADCWTDHKLLRTKLFLTCDHHIPWQPTRRWFGAYKLHDDNIHYTFVDAAMMKVRSQWKEDMPADQM